jgi:phosphoadenosine phosphosulfate reductase
MGGLDAELEWLQARYVPSLPESDIMRLLQDPVLADTAIVSSFGAESAALLHYVNTIRPEIPVIFLDTGKHFAETLSYRDELTERLELHLIVARPEAGTLAEEDPRGGLHAVDPNACCTIRKTFPLQDALEAFASWISGRKRFQSTSREPLPLIERDGTRIKINPLALWSRDYIQTYFQRHALPRHPLEPAGYPLNRMCSLHARACSGRGSPRRPLAAGARQDGMRHPPWSRWALRAQIDGPNPKGQSINWLIIGGYRFSGRALTKWLVGKEPIRCGLDNRFKIDTATLANSL